MRVDNVDLNSFKGSFILKGQTEVLDEICWYMQRKQREPLNKFGFIDLRNSLFVPPQMVREGESLDLFVTNNEKQIIEPKLIQIFYKTVDKSLAEMSLVEKARYLMDNLAKIQDLISHGKPIEGLGKASVTDCLKEILKMDDINRMNAEEAFCGIQKGIFDIKEGVIR